MKKKLLFPAVLLLTAFYAKAQVTIHEAVGWLESAFVKWAPVSGAGSYNVYYTGGAVVNQKIDDQLIRGYGAYFRADVLGLAAGNYTLKVVPVIAGSENAALATTTQSLTVKPHVREGFAFSGNIVPGAYNANGTPKSGSKTFYITASTVNTVTCDVINDKGKPVTYTGLMNILAARGKGFDKTPLIVRMIGLIKAPQINGLKDGNYISFTGFNNTTRKLENITFEGVGDDATAYGYGFYTKRCNSIEIRNVGIMLFGDDAISLETDNSNIWIHNGDFFYGKPGSDADQVKGDGTIDMKYNSSNITISYNHFWESGKTMGCGGSSETVPTFYVSFHHNWFDHVDSRNPRLHYATAHVYNNYYDGVAKYCIGNTTETSVFVEANYFRNCKHPMMISGQGTDTYNPATGTYTAEGTFSGQDGGMTKAFNNKVENANRLVYHTENATQFDAYLATTRNAQVPGTVKSLRGGFSYTNFDISATMYVSNLHSPDEVQSVVTTYAGRVKGGDFKWTFNNSVDDASSDINAPLKAAIVGYTSGLVSVQGARIASTAFAQVTINEAGGWLESAYVKWAPVSGADSYNIYYTGGGVANQMIDNKLIRSYGAYFRADVLGLAAGSYTLKVVPVIAGSENTALATTTQSLTVKPHVREGFAFSGNIIPGAYNANGTPKSGAKIIYITAGTANTVTCDVINDKGKPVTSTGLINILSARNKGYDKTPLIIRMIGLIKAAQVRNLQSGNYIAFIGANTTDRRIENITFEGVGDDATVYGYGFYTKRSKGIEIRNVGIMLFGDDGVSMEADNSNIWVHNCDIFYGAPGSDADQKKGDGSIDMKYNTTNITISFNHFWDSGKSTFAGGATESNPIYFTYHHNWFDHSDSRHPRLCWATTHVYNNYYDGNAGMGLLNTEATSAFVEANYFRNCPYPMMINMQGTNYEIWPNGAQNGGMTKAYNNKIESARKLIYQTERPNDFDAYLVTTRNTKIPNTVKSRKGGNTYSNFDTDASMYSYTPHSPDEVQSVVTTYAGRVKGGDFKWTFNNSVDDASSDINAPLKAAIVGYTSGLVSVQGARTASTAMALADPAAPDKSISIYPNPAKSYTKLQFTLSKASVVTVDVYNVTGMKVKSVANRSFSEGVNTMNINTADLKSGVYMVRIAIDSKTTCSSLIVK